MDRLQTLHQFWSSFGLKAYDENTVPDNALSVNNGRYLTYSVVISNFDEPVLASASLWYKDTAWTDITAKTEQINQALGRGGKVIPFDHGYLWVKRGVPFAQRMGDEDDTIRRMYLNVELEYITAL